MKKEKKPRRLLKVIIGLVAIAAIGAVVLLASSARMANSANARNQDAATIALERTEITRTVSVSGVIESAKVVNIYSTQSYPVKEIFVEVGDTVKAGDVLAQLDMSRLESDISQAEINLRSAIIAAEEEARNNSNSITNARTALESSQLSLARQERSTANAEKELKEAEDEMSEDFDSTIHDKAIEDARLALDRRTKDLETAQKDLDKAINDFDDYTYQNAITDAKINIEKRQADVWDAQWSSGGASSVSLNGFRNAVSAARTVLELKEQALVSAQAALDALENAEAPSEGAIQAAKEAVEKATSERDAADASLQAAERDLAAAQANASATDASPSRVESARFALRDAQNAYNRAITNLERAKNDAADAATKALTNTQNAYDDARRAYERALNDKTKAIENSEDSNKTILERAQRAFEDSHIQLESSQNSLRSAQNSLEQAGSRPATSAASVEIQELTLERLGNQLAEGRIVATASGVITAINANVGGMPNGVIFIIEDTENLYVSARVREHNIGAVEIGQEAIVTTEATGENAYGGAVSFISPRAVSAAGSTSVEFDVQAKLDKPDPAIRIGMNAFLNIVIERKSGIYAVPNSAIVTDERGSFVYAMVDDERREIGVELGIRTMVSVEISGDGLQDGLELLTDPEGLLSGANDTGLYMMFGR